MMCQFLTSLIKHHKGSIPSQLAVYNLIVVSLSGNTLVHRKFTTSTLIKLCEIASSYLTSPTCVELYPCLSPVTPKKQIKRYDQYVKSILATIFPDPTVLILIAGVSLI